MIPCFEFVKGYNAYKVKVGIGINETVNLKIIYINVVHVLELTNWNSLFKIFCVVNVTLS